MSLDDAAGLALMIFIIVVPVSVSVALNFGTARFLPRRNIITHWIINIAMVPTLLVIYGLYAYRSFKPALCNSNSHVGLWCSDLAMDKLGIAFQYFLIFPLGFVSFAIPVTIWFIERKK